MGKRKKEEELPDWSSLTTVLRFPPLGTAASHKAVTRPAIPTASSETSNSSQSSTRRITLRSRFESDSSSHNSSYNQNAMEAEVDVDRRSKQRKMDWLRRNGV